MGNKILRLLPGKQIIWSALNFALIDANGASSLVSSLLPAETLLKLFDEGANLYQQARQPLVQSEEIKSRMRASPGGEQLLDLIHQATSEVLHDALAGG